MTINRQEHMAWCKQRALDYLPGDPRNALTSMLSDLGKHEDTEKLAQDMGQLFLFEIMNASPQSARKFIEGFN